MCEEKLVQHECIFEQHATPVASQRFKSATATKHGSRRSLALSFMSRLLLRALLQSIPCAESRVCPPHGCTATEPAAGTATKHLATLSRNSTPGFA